MKKLFIGIIAMVVTFTSCGTKTQSSTYPANSPVAKYGALQVKGLQLSDKDGNPVQLAGMSSMGLQWCADCYTRESIENLVKEWNINVFRIANYIEEGGYNNDPEGMLQLITQIIDWCGELGIYCIVDWHILTPGNPFAPEYAGAEDFFRLISTKYAGKEHLIYELCNEPNNCQAKDDPDAPWACTKETNVTWEMIVEYADKIIPIIHSACEEANAPLPIIIVGTPQWDQLVDACLKEGRYQGNNKDLSDPLPDRDARLKYGNILYAFHFYAAEHNEGFRKDGKMYYYNMYAYMYEVLGKLPVFCSEFGVTEASGDGKVDFGRTDSWLFLLSGHNAGNQKVSFVNWSYSDKEETSAALEKGVCAKQEWNNTTFSGNYMKKVIRVVNTGKEDVEVLRSENLANLHRYLELNW